jgi:hypothetical protein
MEDEDLQKIAALPGQNNGNLVLQSGCNRFADTALQGHKSLEDALDIFHRNSTKYLRFVTI